MIRPFLFLRANNRLKLAAHLVKNLSARSLVLWFISTVTYFSCCRARSNGSKIHFAEESRKILPREFPLERFRDRLVMPLEGEETLLERFQGQLSLSVMCAIGEK